MLSRLARLATRRGGLVLCAAVVVAGIAGAVGGSVSNVLVGGGFDDPRSDSSTERAQLAAATGVDDRGIVALVDLGAPKGSAEATARVRSVVNTLQSDAAVGVVVDPLSTPGTNLISRNQTRAIVTAYWKPLSNADESAAAKRVQAAFADVTYVRLGGYTLAQDALEHQSAADLTHAEEVAFPILFVLLILVFRSLVAALVPLLVAAMAIVLTFLGLRGIDAITPLSIYALNITTGLGLGLAIDASLLIVSRFREELDAGHTTGAAIHVTLRTAGRTVAFSSVTVAAAMASLLVFPERMLYSMGIGGVLVTLCAAATALVVLPAILALLGPRIDKLAWRPRKLSGGDTGIWFRLAHTVMRYPLLIAVATGTLLFVVAWPAHEMKLSYVNVDDLPAGTSVRVVTQTIVDEFPQTSLAPVVLAVSATPDQADAVASLARSVAAVPGVTTTMPAQSVDAHTWRITATVQGDLYSDAAVATIRQVRSIASDLHYKVGGDTAIFVDLEESILQHVPLAFGIIAIAILVVLFAATGSVVLPIKAVLMNLISLAATFGVLVAIFQWGWFSALLGFTKQTGIETTEPVLIATIAFGLSTDYGVFLLTRIKEMHEGGADTRDAVARGLERTGRVVTAAALLFCVAVSAFATSGIVFIKEVGLGSAAAVLIDATVVRALLVPALMAILGQWNWWAPRPLRWVHRSLRLDQIEGG